MSQPASKAKPGVSAKHSWTPEALKSLATNRLQDLRSRSLKFDAHDLTAMCDAELQARAERQAQAKQQSKDRPPRIGVVSEYHFVCAGSRGVTDEGDGTFRTGSWVVAEDLVKASLKAAAQVALHESKAMPSYRQGVIRGYRLTPRDMINKDNVGIEFHVEPTSEPLAWVGGGAGEKGYRWE